MISYRLESLSLSIFVASFPIDTRRRSVLCRLDRSGAKRSEAFAGFSSCPMVFPSTILKPSRRDGSVCNGDVYPQVTLFGFRYSHRVWPRARDLKLACLTSTTQSRKIEEVCRIIKAVDRVRRSRVRTINCVFFVPQRTLILRLAQHSILK